MQLDLPVILAIVAITTPMAIYRGKKSGFLLIAAALSWVLVFFGIFFSPDSILVWTKNPITAYFVEGVLAFSTIVTMIIGLYQLKD